MIIDLEKIGGIEEYSAGEKKEDGQSFFVGERVFLVMRKNTVEVRTDGKLAKLLKDKYETVMDSRYFGKGGIEIVMSGQIPYEEVEDLVRLSYNLTKEKNEREG